MTLPQPFSALLLAGGRSSRMGVDKATLVVDEQPLWQRQCETLKSTGAAGIFIAGKADGAWSGEGFEVIEDAVENAGPLAGLVAGLRRTGHEWLLVLAVDLPDVTSQFLMALVGEAISSGLGQVPSREEWLQPLAAVYPRRCLPIAEQVLAGEKRSLRRFFRISHREGLVTARAVSEAQQAMFRNLNTREDLATRVSTRR